MSENNENKASRGSVSQIILTTLSSGSKYGYEICKEIEELSNGELVLKQPSLYSSLRRMEEQGLIESYWEDSDIGGKRHYYSLTEKGKEVVEKNKLEGKLNLLINELPIAEDDDITSDKENSENSISSSQEKLFHTNKNTQDKAEKIIENEQENSEKSFVQFDLFEQKMNLIKTSNNQNDVNKKVQQYANKYEDMDNHVSEIEPLENDNSDKKTNNSIDEEPIQIMRSDVFPIKNNMSENNSLDENNDKNNTDLDLSKIDLDKNILNDFSKIENPFEDKKESLSESNTNINSKLEPSASLETNSMTTDMSSLFNEDTKNNDKENVDIEEFTAETNSDINTYEEKDLKPVFENSNQAYLEQNDYRMVIGQLYSDSQLNDPYEQNKYHTFREIFPSTEITEKKKTDSSSEITKHFKEKANENNVDLSYLNNMYAHQGVFIKKHDPTQNNKKIKQYTDVNKLNMVTGLITSLIMFLEIITCYIVLKSGNYIDKNQYVVYFLGIANSLCIAIITTLENFFDRFKLLIISPNFKKGFIIRLLLFIFSIIFIFIIFSLILGLKDLWNLNLISFWLVPLLIASNIVVSHIIYYCLLKSKNFNS